MRSLFVEPAEPVVGQAASLVCQVRNFSAEPVRIPVYANIEGARSSREVEVAAWGGAEVIFPLSFEEEGLKLVQVRLGGDAFPADDWRAVEVPVRESLILAAEGEPGVWSAVGQALPWLTLQAEGGNPKEADFLWIGGWSGDRIDELNEMRVGGPTLLLQSGEWGGGAASKKETSDDGWKVRIAREEAPVFELFRDGEFGNPFAGTFGERMRSQSLGETWAEYLDGVPALQFAAGNDEKSPLLSFNMGLTPPASDWSQQPNFIPFVGELLLNTRPQRGGSSNAALAAGTPLQWYPGPDGGGGAVTLVSEAGEEREVLRKKAEGTVFHESKEGVSPGVWLWQSGGREVARDLVNFPASESDLRLLVDGESGEMRTAESFRRQLALSSGWSLWPWLIGAAILFLILEPALILWRPKAAGQGAMKGGSAL